MRVWVQWAQATPADWQVVDVSNIARWRQTPRKADPTGTDPTVDDAPGWVHALGLMGITFSADHYAVEQAAGGPGVRIHTVNDDPVDWPPGWRHAFVWTIRPPRHDDRFGRDNTDIALTVYTEQQARDTYWPRGLTTTAGPATFLPWADYSWPPQNLVRHGVQLPDALHAAHEAARSPLPPWDDPEWRS